MSCFPKPTSTNHNLDSENFLTKWANIQERLLRVRKMNDSIYKHIATEKKATQLGERCKKSSHPIINLPHSLISPVLILNLKTEIYGLRRVARLVGALSRCTKVAGSTPPSGHIQESTNECMNKWIQSMFLSLSNKIKKLKTAKIKISYKEQRCRGQRKKSPWSTMK